MVTEQRNVETSLQLVEPSLDLIHRKERKSGQSLVVAFEVYVGVEMPHPQLFDGSAYHLYIVAQAELVADSGQASSESNICATSNSERERIFRVRKKNVLETLTSDPLDCWNCPGPMLVSHISTSSIQARSEVEGGIPSDSPRSRVPKVSTDAE